MTKSHKTFFFAFARVKIKKYLNQQRRNIQIYIALGPGPYS
jgi:hypothetical protein